MIILFFSRYQRQVALSFLLIIYLQMALPIHAAARVHVHRPFPGYVGGTGSTTVWKHNDRGLERGAPAALYSAPNSVVKSTPIKPAFNPAKTFSSGPTQPEMQSFQSVNANNMVDLFTGDFSYNIPLLDVGGYPINIHYASGITMDQEASWVGLGWNINPGTITRNMRGLPDDFNGVDRVEKTLSLKKNKTIGVTAGVNVELLGGSLSLGASLGVFHNNYKGWGTETGINAGINSGGNASGAMTLGLGVNNNSQNGLDISPSLSFKIGSENDKAVGNVSIGSNYNSRTGINGLQMTGQISQQKTAENNGAKVRGSASVAMLIAGITFSKPSFTPAITIPFTSSQYAFKVKLGSEAYAVHPNASVRGYGSVQKIAPEDTAQSLPAYGYLYFQEARGNQNALLDFNREKEIAFREKEPHIAVPMYTYDSYCINGEGTGGMFRPYRGDIGFVYDHAMTSKSNSNSFSLDLGFGTWFHGGLDYDGIFADTKNKPWLGDNLLKDVIPFKRSDSTYESVYFKNPGEKTSVDQSYYNAIGDTRLMRVDLNPLYEQSVATVTATRRLSTFSNSLATGKIILSNNVFRKNRDKRTQVISYLNAAEASSVGLDRTIRSYNINSFPTVACNTNYTLVDRVDRSQSDVKDQIRKPHHLSEVTVLNNDGRRYIYGIPAYNFSQREVSFSVDQQLAGKKAFNALTGQVGYNEGLDNTTNNDKGIDNYFNRELMPSYAHSFLLSGILSPDYSDITGDGISEDDPGEAIKFNYSRIYDYSNRYTWRAPFDSAAYNEGLKTDNRDEKASYSYGEREVWYLNSVESKSMMATFVLDVDNPRLDGYGVKGENGHLDASKKSYRLKEINLYAKADYIKNGMADAKPIKTVHFDYSYELCKKNPSSVQDSGKLTLKRIWFTYNKNEKRPLNPYVFTYHSNNPGYLKGANDRWGNYKDSRNNPVQLSNADYPYSLQTGGSNNWDSTKAAANAAAWTLTKIKLPSGGELRVTYESDDYGYVQNKRAMQMFTIAGFGSDPSATPSASLYPQNGKGSDFQYVFINVTDAVSTKQEIQSKYLEGVERLYFKLFVQVPGDRWGKGGEYVPFYADIDGTNYGVKGTGASKLIWIKLATLPDGAPPAVAATQFLRLNLQSKAYPMSEPGDDVDAADFIKMILTAAGNITDAVKGFGGHGRSQNLCNAVTVSQSFVRLNNPLFKKLGGGLRVKKVEVYDNFRAMTKGQQQDATYGQQYDYSTTAMINNIPTRISSGVAAYEPAIGGEENPFHVPVDYTEKIAPLTPTNYKYTEEPLGETYFPGPMVGYSKVSVQSINNKQKSATGIEQTEFYTTYDFPTVWEFTPLDNESKKTYNPPIRNFFKLFARHEVTLSQGFKVELNDMNGKMKSQSSFAQTDLVNPISYTYNYYNVEKEATLNKQLSANVPVMDSANGKVNNGQLGKDIEVMIDLREQTSRTINASVESNIDIVPAGPFPLILPSLIPIGSSETNRFRSVAVMKVVNRYGILDSVVHMENGSIVSTKNMVYDGVTGDVLLSKTNNEFDDPIYNFSYPAHWAYSGMGPACRNIGASWQQVNFRQGKMYIGATQFNTDNNFESGDELLVRSANIRLPLENDTCNAAFYTYIGQPTTKKVWAIEAAKGKEGHKGIYFIDKDGIPFSATGAYIKILRSGKRNMMSTPVGAVTSLASPLRTSGAITNVVFDAASQAVNASAAQFKDFWRVDSLAYKKDTTIIIARLADSVVNRAFNVNEVYTMQRKKVSDPQYFPDYNGAVRTFSSDNGSGGLDFYNKTWMKFDITTDATDPLPANSVITKANLYLYNNDVTTAIEPHSNLRGSTSSNQGYLRQVRGQWIAAYLRLFPNAASALFNESGQGLTNPSVQSIIKPTPAGISFRRNDTINITPQVQGMVDDYYNTLSTPNVVANALVLGLVNTGGQRNKLKNQLSYNITGTITGHSIRNQAFAEVSYCKPCASGSRPYFSNTPKQGYYCNDLPKDTFVCKPNIVDSAVNPYRWGILGNWRMLRAYTYYSNRRDSVATAETNIRKDGQIASFAPFWSFTNNMMRASTDTNRWVWNSEMTLFNRKGYEIENKDPLNRYNGGQYGYNQTLPVAVGQNTRSREMMFDSFEDYGYSTDACIGCAVPRFINLANAPASLIDNVSHSGKYSLRVNGNQTTSTVVKIATAAEDATEAYLSLRIDTTRRIKTIVNGNGAGLTGRFYKSSSSTTPCVTLTNQIDYNWGRNGGPGGSCGIDNFNAVWTGKIQPRYTDNYIFYSNHDDGIKITVNGVLLMSKPSPSPAGDSSSVISLQAGKLYSIKVEYTEVNDLSYVNLQWRSKGGEQSLEVVPRAQLYSDATTDAVVSNTITYDTTYCVYARSPKGKRLTNDLFSPMQGSQMLVSAWVKEEQPCVSGSYQNSQLVLSFNTSTPTVVTLKPTGKIIEGWQRVEAFVDIPNDATSMTVSLQSTNASIPVYFDDLRMHPFNSNIKSFVYNPVNLRLMAELDENNYASFYEYDDDGTLIRLKKETERGIKTIKETRSALLKE